MPCGLLVDNPKVSFESDSILFDFCAGERDCSTFGELAWFMGLKDSQVTSEYLCGPALKGAPRPHSRPAVLTCLNEKSSACF